MMATFVTCTPAPVSIPPAFGKKETLSLPSQTLDISLLVNTLFGGASVDERGPVEHYVGAVCSGEGR
jgi:hypothetical protein